uniref:Uncharacterized protein n=1 Tax=viral metagenome TaxID=1070528 RepID=A0A6C0BY03_9ZZZZ
MASRKRGHKGKRHSSSSRRSRRMYRVPGKPGARSQAGGSHLNPATYAAGGSEGAAPYVLSQYGNGNTQWDNVFTGSGASPYGNQLVNLQHPGVTSPASLSPPPTQKGGSRKRGKGRGKKGGFIGSVLSQAVVPFGLLALQQSYGRRMKSRRTGRK